LSVRTLVLALALAFAGCDPGDAGSDGCQKSADCKNGGECIAGACVMLSSPLDASIPDLAAGG
jgi:hypothetical protein